MSMHASPSRLLLKLSGESLRGSGSFGVDQTATLAVAKALSSLASPSLELGIVMGGGNWLRGAQTASLGMERTSADQMGMLATIMNGLALQQALLQLGVKASLFTGLECPQVAERFTVRAANAALERGEICLFVGGTGHPYFTTDTAAALRASELRCDALCKATKVDGIYSADPMKQPGAVRYQTISYSQVLHEQLGFMDATAISLCMQSNVPIYLFKMDLLGSSTLWNDLKEGKYGSCVLKKSCCFR